ncbi:MAG: phage holin family protein [Tissierellia bacterium]|nr:phage holin family protein [Tissierellia bacterium]
MVKLIIKVLVSALAIFIAALLPLGFKVENFGAAIVAAIVIGILDWAINKFTGIDASPFGRGAVGFITAAIIIFLTGRLVDGFHATVMGSLVGALILGVVNMIIPGEKTM